MDVIGFGSLCIDYFVEVNSKTLKKYHLKPEDDFLFEDIKLDPQKFFSENHIIAKSPGSIPFNTIAVLSSLGVKTGFVGISGNDENAKLWQKAHPKIDKSKVLPLGKMSVCACVLSNKGKSRAFLSDLNTEDNELFDNIDFDYLNNAKIIHIGPFLLEQKKALKELEKVLEKTKGPKVSFTPSTIFVKYGLKKLEPIVKKTDYLFLNKNEMKLLTKKDPSKGSKELIKLGPEIVICTLGSKGALITTKDKQIEIKPKVVKNIIDTTGAGDTFAAGILYGILNNKPLEESGDFATELAIKALSNYGLSWLNQ